MALHYTIDETQRLVTVVGQHGNEEDWKALLSRVFHDPRYRSGFAFLRDLRAETTVLDAASARRMMLAVSGFWTYLQPSRAAIVTSAEVPLDMAAHIFADRDALPVRVFTSYEQAREWLRHGMP